MKKNIRIISLFLALSMLFCFTGCDKKPSSNTQATTVSTTPVTTPEPTEPPVDWAVVYSDAVGRLEAAQDMTLSVETSTVTTVAGKEFPSASSYEVQYQGLGTETLLACAKESNTYGEYTFDADIAFSEGTMYCTMGEVSFSSPVEAEAFQKAYFPAVLFSLENYGQVSGQKGETSVVSFSAPTAVEAWLPEEDVTLLDCLGTATLDADGNLIASECTVTYEYGPATITTNIQVTVNTEPVCVSIPTDTEDYLQMESPDALWMIEQAYGYMNYAQTYSATVLTLINSDPAGFMLNEQHNLNSYCSAEEYMSKYETSSYEINYAYNGCETSQEAEQTFIDGKFSLVENGRRPIGDASVTQEVMQTSLRNILSQDMFMLTDLENARCMDLGSLYFYAFTGSDEAAIALRDRLSLSVFGMTGYLEELASKYVTNGFEMYLSIDKYTGLPISVGIEFSCTHTIYGRKYTTSYQFYESMDLASNSAYEAVSGERAPETEPAEKAKPLFYHVTGADGQEMWLLGTIHIGDERTGYLPQEIYDAFAASDALALECDTEAFDKQMEADEELQKQVSECYYYSKKKTIEDHLDTPELYEYASALLRATGNYNYNSEQLKAYTWSSSIESFYLQQSYHLTPEKGVETRLTDLAQEQNKPIREVESSLFQIKMLTGFSDELQEFMLYSTVSSSARDYVERTEELYEMWCAGDESALIEYITEDEIWEITEEDFDMENLTEEESQEIQAILADKGNINASLAKIQAEYQTAMESNRNAAMLEVAKEYLESGDVVFFAVGLAHLLADDGLVNTLRDAGYTVELVQYTK